MCGYRIHQNIILGNFLRAFQTISNYERLFKQIKELCMLDSIDLSLREKKHALAHVA